MLIYMFCFLYKPIGDVLVKITNLNAAKLKTLLKEQGLSMKYFNDMLGKNRSYLSNVLTGSDSISLEDLEKVADKLNTTVDYLTDKTDQKEKPTDLSEDKAALNEMLLIMTDEQIAKMRDIAKDILGK